MKDRRALFGAIFVLAIVLDQFTKAWVRHSLMEGQYAGWPFPGVFEITLNYNAGIAFGMLQGKGVFMAPVSIAIGGASIWYCLRHPKESRWTHVTLALMAAGALGNLVDRVAFGRVTDMVYASFIHFPVFNVADSCITVAGFMLAIGWLAESVRDAKAKRSGVAGDGA